MLNDYERQLLRSCLANAVGTLDFASREAQDLFEWVTENADLLDLDISRAHSSHGRPDIRRHPSREDAAKEWPHLREALAKQAAGGRPRRAAKDGIARGLASLGRELALSSTDIAILEVLLLYRISPIMEDLVDAFSRRGGRREIYWLARVALPRLLGVPRGSVASRLAPDAPLVRSGLVVVDDHHGGCKVISRLCRLASLEYATAVDAHHLLFDMGPPGELEWRDFSHIADDRDQVAHLLQGCLEAGAGANILVHGPPGTGKTEFCKTVAKQLNAVLVCVGESDDDGQEPHHRERLQELLLAHRLLANSRRTILLFDEMDDLLCGDAMTRIGGLWPRDRGPTSKVFMHRLLERTPMPTLWTSNSASQISPAVLRRMTFALELRKPSPKVRERVWGRLLARQGIKATEEDARALARSFDLAPGAAAGAVAGAGLGGGDMAAVRRGVRSLARVLSADQPPQRLPRRFDPTLIRADMDPVRLSDQFASTGERRLSLCLQGPSGTGKSAFVRHLAERLGLEVLQKRASDLMSMYVGGTEKRIAAAFQEACADKAFLVLDEADSLLADRRFAVRSWEVSQVNEMLTWMESHPLPFACTTNFGEHLDPATLRRFTFKITLDYLNAAQVSAAFRLYFELDPPAQIDALAMLTPGDFALVQSKAKILGQLGDAAALAAMLDEECRAKTGTRKRVGFA